MTDETTPCSACPLCRARSLVARVSPRTRAAVVASARDLVTALSTALAEIAVPSTGAAEPDPSEDPGAADGPIPVEDDEAADETRVPRRA